MFQVCSDFRVHLVIFELVEQQLQQKNTFFNTHPPTTTRSLYITLSPKGRFGNSSSNSNNTKKYRNVGNLGFFVPNIIELTTSSWHTFVRHPFGDVSGTVPQPALDLHWRGREWHLCPHWPAARWKKNSQHWGHRDWRIDMRRNSMK